MKSPNLITFQSHDTAKVSNIIYNNKNDETREASWSSGEHQGLTV